MNPDVANNGGTTGKRLGGITGKGFLPGRSGNPSGRPKRRPISDRNADLAETPLPDDVRQALRLKKGATQGDAIALAMARQAIKGKTQAAREIREAIEGRATQRIELGDEDGGPEIRIQIVHVGGMHEGDDEPATTRPALTPGMCFRIRQSRKHISPSRQQHCIICRPKAPARSRRVERTAAANQVLFPSDLAGRCVSKYARTSWSPTLRWARAGVSGVSSCNPLLRHPRQMSGPSWNPKNKGRNASSGISMVKWRDSFALITSKL